MGARREALKRQFFFKKDGVNWSDLYASDRIRLGIVEMILRDLAAKALELMIEQDEFGVLVIRPHQDDAVFMTLDELAEDKKLAEAHDDSDAVALLSSFLEALAKLDPRVKVPIMLCDHLGAKLIFIDTQDPIAPLREELEFSFQKGRDAG